MPDLHAQFRNSIRAKQSALPMVVLLCFVLLALLTVVQVAHIHADPVAADHCPLCISMHSAAPVAAAAAAVVLIQIGCSAPVFETHTTVRLLHPKLFIRPPPAGR